jgi:uncharacterized membrane protein YgdD (TMEM256/DUF423 family)
MLNRLVFWGIVLAGLSVVFGAFGAHLIQPILAELEPVPKKTPPMEVFKTGVEYQFFHAIALIVTGLLYKQRSNRMVKNAGLLFILGIIMFSGSLYVITIGNLLDRNFSFVGPITPIGGLSFIVGWVLLAITFGSKSHTSRS